MFGIEEKGNGDPAHTHSVHSSPGIEDLDIFAPGGGGGWVLHTGPDISNAGVSTKKKERKRDWAYVQIRKGGGGVGTCF